MARGRGFEPPAPFFVLARGEFRYQAGLAHKRLARKQSDLINWSRLLFTPPKTTSQRVFVARGSGGAVMFHSFLLRGLTRLELELELLKILLENEVNESLRQAFGKASAGGPYTGTYRVY